MSALILVHNVPIGYSIVSGNLCPENGVYTYNKRHCICKRGETMPLCNGKAIVWALESYWVS